jgi:pyruvate kinase
MTGVAAHIATDDADRQGVSDVGGTSALAALSAQISTLRAELVTEADGWRPWTEGRDSDRDASARNLLQYMALRRHDLRELQPALVDLGLSSLGRSEGHVLASVDAVIHALDALSRCPPSESSSDRPISVGRSTEVLARRTGALLGTPPPGRPTRIMVTMPSEAAHDPTVVRELLLAGMDCMRVNCAHDSPRDWQAMVDGLRSAERETGRSARVEVDLPGPKLRTGRIGPKADRDAKGDYLRLCVDDRLELTRDPPASTAKAGFPRIECSLPEAFGAVRDGDCVWLDDGKLGGLVESAGAQSIVVRITDAAPSGSKLREGKGINLPDTELDIDLLGAHSEEALRFAVAQADIVALSFVSRASEIKRIHERLDACDRPQVGIVLKIETQRAFEQLPGLLLAALAGGRPAGVMIARGDLAVECGYERLAEVQEEILWLCEAAHVPVIWATEVLDRLARTGRPTRAEITDAAMSSRAECVMLNKGPQIVRAIAVLDNILRRMGENQTKKRALMRRLGEADYTRTPPAPAAPLIFRE